MAENNATSLKLNTNLKNCSKCEKIARKNNRYCVYHHNEYMRNWRKTHKPTESQRKKINARAYARVYYYRGKIKKEPCKICGKSSVQRHHINYDEPLNIIWLCAECHAYQHK